MLSAIDRIRDAVNVAPVNNRDTQLRSGDIERISGALQFIPASDRDTWIRMGMAIKSQLGAAGYDLWDGWSQQADSYNIRDARDVWKSIRDDGTVTIRTLFHEAKANDWRDDGTYQKPTAEELTKRKRSAAQRPAKDKAEIARERTGTATKAAAILDATTEASADHPYLSRKHVSPVSTLREIDANVAAVILGYPPMSSGEALNGRLLVVPVMRADGLSTVELIDPDGRKAALAGRGTKAGGYWRSEPLPDGDGDGLTLLIGEGVATVLSGMQACGHPAVAALSSGNLLSIARAMRKRYPAAVLVILADRVKATGEPDPHAIEAAQSVRGKLAIPDFGTDRPTDATDINDLAQRCGTEAVGRAIANVNSPATATHQPGEGNAPIGGSDGLPQPRRFVDDGADLQRLAALPPLAYDRVRNEEAKRLGVRTSTLDQVVAKRREQPVETDGLPELFARVEPWPSEVDGAALLDDLADSARRFVTLPEHADVVLALWTVFTHTIDAAEVAPILAVTAPEKRCGKTTLLQWLSSLVCREMPASNITAAALFRAVEKWHPTLLVDEADTFLAKSDELRGIINCGHTRRSAFVIRTVVRRPRTDYVHDLGGKGHRDDRGLAGHDSRPRNPHRDAATVAAGADRVHARYRRALHYVEKADRALVAGPHQRRKGRTAGYACRLA